MEQKEIGKTKDVGFQIGVRRTFTISPQQAWDIITSAEGINLWLGKIPDMALEKGKRYKTEDGVEGEFRVVSYGSHLRLTWQPKGWQKPSTFQLRVISTQSGKTTISFHQEHLQSGVEREQMRTHWEDILEKLETILY